MSILKIARMGHPVLRQKAAPVPVGDIGSPEIRRLIDDMVETMREYSGVGLAAPQVHVPRQVIVVAADREGGGGAPPTVLVNPQITLASRKTEEDWEGCLSIPDIRGRVPRSTEIKVRAHDRAGKEVALSAKGFFARVIQHEVDHLQGVLFPDRMMDFSTLTFMEECARYWMKEPKEGGE